MIQTSVWCLDLGGFVPDIISQQAEDCVFFKQGMITCLFFVNACMCLINFFSDRADDILTSSGLSQSIYEYILSSRSICILLMGLTIIPEVHPNGMQGSI